MAVYKFKDMLKLREGERVKLARFREKLGQVEVYATFSPAGKIERKAGEVYLVFEHGELNISKSRANCFFIRDAEIEEKSLFYSNFLN